RTRRTGDLIRIEVEDTGSGIPPNLLERIFNPFFTTKPTGSGTGLGLSISLGIVREHEGRIWAENAPHGGARFVIELPMVTPHGTGEPRAMPAVTPVTDRLHVLVVDDEASVRVALQRYLSSRGHEVETTASGKEALARMREDSFDAVIIDMRMPDLSGEQVFQELKGRDPTSAERVIFTTGELVDDRGRRIGRAGGAGSRPPIDRITSPPFNGRPESAGARTTSTPSLVPKYSPRSALRLASSRSPHGEPNENSKSIPGILGMIMVR